MDPYSIEKLENVWLWLIAASSGLVPAVAVGSGLYFFLSGATLLQGFLAFITCETVTTLVAYRFWKIQGIREKQKLGLS